MHTIDESQESILRALTRTDEGQELPPAILARYWELKRLTDRLGYARPSPDVLALLVLLAGEGRADPQDAKLRFIPELYHAHEIAIGDPIEVIWRKKPRPAKFLGITADHRVKFELDGSEREVDAADAKPLALQGA